MRVKKGKKTIPHTTDRLTQPDPTRSLPERISHTDRDWKEVNIVRARACIAPKMDCKRGARMHQDLVCTLI